MTRPSTTRTHKRALRKLQKLLSQDATDAAALADLRYVNDEEPGIHRTRKGRGFTYCDAEGAPVDDKETVARIRSLRIPPAWTGVWICADRNGHIQATGRDAEGRKQYIYHTRWARVRSDAKFSRLALFGHGLPALRSHLDRDLARSGYGLERMVALLVYLLDKTHIRIGNPEYVRDGTYGLTTLLNEHLSVSGAELRFSFRGKSGKYHEVGLRDRRLARLVQRCQELPGQSLFVYKGEDGQWHNVTSTDVNDYLRRQMGQHFSAKDFRTWGATVGVTDALLEHVRQGEPPKESHIRQAIKSAAATLGHTSTVCRTYYVHPAILDAYRAGTLQDAVEPQPRLTNAESAVLSILLTQLDIPPEVLDEFAAMTAEHATTP